MKIGSRFSQEAPQILINLFCVLSDTVKVIGQPSWTEYEFSPSNNHICPVKQCDLPDLLSKTKKTGCCGNPVQEIKIFKLI